MILITLLCDSYARNRNIHRDETILNWKTDINLVNFVLNETEHGGRNKQYKHTITLQEYCLFYLQ
jgi:hypothetical protein